MVNLNSFCRRRWRGIPLGDHLQRGTKFCFGPTMVRQIPAFWFFAAAHFVRF